MGDLGDYWRDIEEYFRDRQRNPEKYFTKVEIKAYQKRVAKRKAKREKIKDEIESISKELGYELKIYPNNGQYSFGKSLDWWTTTGTAIERKTRKEHFISFSDTEKLKIVLSQLKT